ncbi:sensor histidine kinase [Paenibacillus sp. GP183]|uniref:sensor histidine kinase n=1 Tax=Paenibacillus sp. GP183 TaxID=1882751 RepID=UPI000895A33A|nr:sensor histidine kinase [Paenibacillus sp. GP183]SEC14805.1 Signal transduction histidine kinase [Paenibacillus sp. GP183]
MVQRKQFEWVDWSLFAIFIGSFAVNVLFMATSPKEFEHTTTQFLLGAFTAAFAFPMIFWRPNYVNPVWFPVAVLLSIGSVQLYLTWLTQVSYGILYCPLIVVGYLSDRKNAWWTAPVFILGFPIASFFLIHGGPTLIGFVFSIVNGTLFFGIGLGIQRFQNTIDKSKKLLQENQYQYQLIHQQNKVLEQYANQIEYQTLVEERNRMARELHDTVGHTFTSVIMGMDAVSYLIEASPQKALERLDILRHVTRNGLEEVRRTIHQMAPVGDDLLLSLQLAGLVNEFALHTGTKVHVETRGTEYDLPKQTKLTFIRCLQEALTNAKRHGSASTVHVVLIFQANRVELSIEDDGEGTNEFKAGFGITSMQERISALQGMLHVKSASGRGTTVVCSIPTRLEAYREA